MVELMPGDVADGVSGDQFKTLLGSCVSVILTDPRRTVGAMCHIVHVGVPNTANAHNTAYGCVALNEMHHRLQQRGVTTRLCEAYVYGGGNMFPQLPGVRNIGMANAHWVLDALNNEGIYVVDRHLGGNGYRKVAWTVGAAAPQVDVVFVEQGSMAL